jgi:hypothetical protein
VLCLSGRTLGVGSNGCGPRPMDPYIVWSEPATFSYVLRLLAAGQADLPTVGRFVSPPRAAAVTGQRSRDGLISLVCSTTGAKIEYALGESAWQTYAGPFETKQTGAISVRATADGVLPYHDPTGVAGRCPLPAIRGLERS